MPTIDDVYPSAFIKAATLQGKEASLTIKDATVDTVGQGDDARKQIVLTFDETEKSFGLNRTNANEIASAYGNNFEQWTGKQITLYPTTTNYPSPGTPCVRVRIPRESVSGDDLPF